MRQALKNQSHAPNQMPNAALVLHQGLRSFSKQDEDAKRDLVDAVAALDVRVGHAYEAHFKRWEALLPTLAETGMVTQLRSAKATSRLVVGLGGKGILEAGLSLHHTHGVPYLPGSALKGLASSFAAQRLGGAWAKGGEAHTALFGTTEESGLVIFHDALWQPNPNQRKPLLPDVLTVHHPEYYQEGGKEPPADWDSPNPVPFLTVSPSASFRVALTGPEGAWLASAWELLGWALLEYGIGGKTSAGYGRLKLEGTAAASQRLGAPPKAAEGPLEIKVKAWGTNAGNLLYKPQGKDFVKEWQAATNQADKKAAAKALFAALDASPNAKAFHKDLAKQPWYQEMSNLIQA